MNFICLGRFGDIVNSIPLFYSAHLAGSRPKVVVARDFASIFDGCSYVDPVVFPGDYADLPRAIQWARSRGIISPRICQVYMHPTAWKAPKQTESYNLEAWTIANALPLWNTMPLVFDRRDRARESRLAEKVLGDGSDQRPIVLTSLAGTSSPLKEAPKLWAQLEATGNQGGAYRLVDISHLKAERVYDLIGLMDRASAIVSIDTLHLHLARATNCPVFALRNNGWFGSTCPPQTVFGVRYSEMANRIPGIANELAMFCNQSRSSGAAIQVVDVFGNEDRHKRACSTWNNCIQVHRSSWGRDARDIGDTRPLPYLKDLLTAGLGASLHSGDCIVWHNDDVCLAPNALRSIHDHVRKWDFCCTRRLEDPSYVHMGRELMAFRAGWLRDNLHRLPDTILGASDFDLFYAAWLRKERGIITTGSNLTLDMLPVDIPAGLAMHEKHESSWNTRERIAAPSTQHNRRLFREWARRELPNLRFTSENIVTK